MNPVDDDLGAPQEDIPRGALIVHRFISAFPALAKYQLVTKIVQILILFPGFWALTHLLLNSAGYVALTNFNAPAFLLSWQGGVWSAAVIVLIFLTLLMEVGGFMMISAVKLRGQPDPSYTSVLRATWRAIPSMLGSGTIILLLMLLVVLPLAGSSLSLSFLVGFRIPNFITSVIYATPVYYALYVGVMALLYVLTVGGAFLFHFILLGHLKTGRALRASFGLVKRHFWRFFFFIVVNVFAVAMIAVGVIVTGTLIYHLVGDLLDSHPLWHDTLYLSSTFIGALLTAAAAYIATPFFVFALTDRYYAYLQADAAKEAARNAVAFATMIAEQQDAIAQAGGLGGRPRPVAETPPADPPQPTARELYERMPRLVGKTRPSLLDRLAKLTPIVVLGAVASTVFAAYVIARDAEDFIFDNDIPVIAHRGGQGDSLVENTLPAIEEAIGRGADYVEVDIQRTADGHYVLHHDDTYLRLTGDPRPVTQVTLKDAQALDFAPAGSRGEPLRILTADELFEATKGRIGIFLELKGKSADRRMVDDMVALIKKHDMREQVVIMSLSYDLIEYVEERYPEMLSGFTYFLSFGDATRLVGDYLIVEEDNLTLNDLHEFHAAGKRVAVWTLNDVDSMRKFVHWPIDGAITDYVGRWNRIANERNAMSSMELLRIFFFGEVR